MSTPTPRPEPGTGIPSTCRPSHSTRPGEVRPQRWRISTLLTSCVCLLQGCPRPGCRCPRPSSQARCWARGPCSPRRSGSTGPYQGEATPHPDRSFRFMSSSSRTVISNLSLLSGIAVRSGITSHVIAEIFSNLLQNIFVCSAYYC